MKGRDWYDLIWYAGNHPEYRLKHLEERSRQSGHYLDKTPFTHALVMEMLRQRLEAVDIEQMKEDVRPFVRDAFALSIWSKNFFLDAFKRLTAV